MVGLVKVSGNSISSLEDNKGNLLNQGLFEEEPEDQPVSLEVRERKRGRKRTSRISRSCPTAEMQRFLPIPYPTDLWHFKFTYQTTFPSSFSF